jgi:radical SAM protein with 4Fe4S-binding SPASM domain
MPVPFFHEIRVENTNSCGYKCVMCPREKQTRAIGFMSLKDFSLILERIKSFQGVVHLHGFGEPLLDRQLVQKVGQLKQKHPQSKSMIFSTLGVSVKEDFFPKLLEAGLNGLVVSLYGYTNETYQKIHGIDRLSLVKKNLSLLSQAKKRFQDTFVCSIKLADASLSSSLPIHKDPERDAFCTWVKELGFDTHEWSYVHNYGEGRGYNIPNSEKMCPVINGNRRNILNITWDLNVIPCCYDFNATIRFGNLRNQTLEEIFSSPEYFAFVIAHKTNALSAYPACQNCEKHDSGKD